MKITTTILLFALATVTFAQKQNATLLLRDGTSLVGFARINNSHKIVFKETKDSEKKTFDYTNVSKILIEENGKDVEYFYKVIEDGPFKVMLIEIIQQGKINLYRYIQSGTSSIPNANGGFSMGMSSTKTTYFMSKKNDDVAVNLRIGNTYSKKFKKIAKEYFNDCRDLTDKISNKSFHRYDITGIIKYYNNDCK